MKHVYYYAVGKPLDSGLATVHDEFMRRLKRWVILNPKLLKPEKHGDTQTICKTESSRILEALPENAFLVLLDERGKQYSSEALSEHCSTWLAASQPLVFVIGGAYGVSAALRERADIVWSLSSLVFPHEIVRLLLVEQLYRAFAINDNLPYHHK